MRTAQEIIDDRIVTKKDGSYDVDFLEVKDVLKSMQEYAEEYHRAELLKLNKSDVISSVCKTCGHPFDDDVCCGDCIDKQTD